MAGPFTRLRRRWMLTCKEVNEFLIDYLEGTLDERTQRQFERHINRCENCQSYLDQYRKTIEMVKEADDVPPPPPGLAEETLAFLNKAWKEDTRPNADQ